MGQLEGRPETAFNVGRTGYIGPGWHVDGGVVRYSVDADIVGSPPSYVPNYDYKKAVMGATIQDSAEAWNGEVHGHTPFYKGGDTNVEIGVFWDGTDGKCNGAIALACIDNQGLNYPHVAEDREIWVRVPPQPNRNVGGRTAYWITDPADFALEAIIPVKMFLLQAIVGHELGHATGLDHYFSYYVYHWMSSGSRGSDTTTEPTDIDAEGMYQATKGHGH